MGKVSKKKSTGKAKIATHKITKDYVNDPFFVKKREIGAAFLEKVGLPKSFKKSQGK